MGTRVRSGRAAEEIAMFIGPAPPEGTELHLNEMRWNFYACDELDCGFWYKTDYDVKAPVLEHCVFCPLLQRKVQIRLVGRGRKGYEELVRLGHKDHIFPVDLHSFPYVMDPRPSRRVSQELYERWLSLVDGIQMRIAFEKNKRKRDVSGG
jgi:hypothetical protein